MLAYASNRHQSSGHPTLLAVIVGGHVLALSLILAAKMEVAVRAPPLQTVVEAIPLPPPPPVAEPERQPTMPVPASSVDQVIPIVAPPIPQPFDPASALPRVTAGPTLPLSIGNDVVPIPVPVVRTGPIFRTPANSVRPPYPDLKRSAGEEATLRLRLVIDAGGRVISVDPVGVADPDFLASARRHILRSWRYTPAKEGERSVRSTTVITLKFELDG